MSGNLKQGYEYRRARERILEKYSLSPKDYADMVESQAGGCAICGEMFHETDRALPVDHDHNTGQVRGVLCTLCNTMLGCAKDCPTILRIAANYLEVCESNKRQVERKSLLD